MSINQVINGKNRLVEHPNRYKLNAVSGQANTYDFEKQPGEITENGTPYSKLILDKIDNVLSYLQPSLEQAKKTISIPRLTFNGINPEWAGQGDISNKIDLLNEYNIKTYFATYNDAYVFKSAGGKETSRTVLYSSPLGNTNFKSDGILSMLNKTSEIASDEAIVTYSDASATTYDFVIDFNGNTYSGELNYCFHANMSGGSVNVYKDESNVSLDSLTLPIGYDRTLHTFTFNNVKKLRIHFDAVLRRSSSSYDPLYIHSFYFTNLTSIQYQNQFTLNNNGNTFTNNQRLLINTVLNKIPASTFDTVKTTSSISGSYVVSQLMPLDNGNTMIIMHYTKNLYFIIINKNGEIVKSATSAGVNFQYSIQAYKLNNGNILIAGYETTSDNCPAFVIYDQDGTLVQSVVKSTTNYVLLLGTQLSNGDIYILEPKSDYSVQNILKITTNGLSYSSINIPNVSSSYRVWNIIENDNNIMVIGYNTYTQKIFIEIINYNGSVVKNLTEFDTLGSPNKIVKLSNDNIMIISVNQSNYYITIVDKQGNLISSSQSEYIGDVVLLKLSNNNILNISKDYINILNNNGEILYRYTSALSLASTSAIEMKNGNIMIIVRDSQNSNVGKLAIFDYELNLLYGFIDIGQYYQGPLISETIGEDGNVVVAGYYNVTSYYYVCNPKAPISSNTLNDIDIDTMLKDKKYYELLYNESQNKFIAEEVRNAN